jgi:hypothetical protein
VQEVELEEIRRYLERDGELIPASEAEACVPDKHGLYSIIIDGPGSLPAPFSDYMRRKEHRVIYLGRASGAFLSKRLVENDLRHKGNATFFRSLGAVLGYSPPKGSLFGKANQENYRFKNPDKQEIVDWINEHLEIRCIPLKLEDIALERRIINDLRPVLNIDGNPDVPRELIDLRDECKTIARTQSE